MNPRILLASMLFAFAGAHACADPNPQTSSETHFQCVWDTDCPHGESCVAKKCQPPSAPHDAGAHVVDTRSQGDGSIGTVPKDLSSRPPMMDAQPQGMWNGPTFDCTSLPPPSILTAADQACDALAAAACTQMDACMPGAWLFPDQATLPHDANLCRQRLTIACSAAMALPGSPTPEAVTECAARLPSFSCKQVYEAERYGTGNGGRRPLNHEAALELCGVHGALPRNAQCTSDIQCGDGVCSGGCINGPCDSCSRCQPFLAIGDQCEVWDNRCPLGSFPYEHWVIETKPDGSVTGGYRASTTCEKLGNEGDPCPGKGAQQSTVSTPISTTPSDGCELGLACNEAQCVPALKEGETCFDMTIGFPGHRECDAFRGLACIDRICTRVAQPSLQACRYVKDGAPCGPFSAYGDCPNTCLYPAIPTKAPGDTNALYCTLDLPDMCWGDSGL